jgi:hypothetical protein
MKLIEEFDYALWNDTDGGCQEVNNKCEAIANTFAIKFAKWLVVHCDYKGLLMWDYKGKNYTCVELIKIFKNDVNFGYNVE